MPLSLLSAVLSVVAVVVCATQPGTLSVREPRRVVLLNVEAWPLYRVMAAFLFPLVSVALAVRDYRRGGRKTAIVAGFLAATAVALGTWVIVVSH